MRASKGLGPAQRKLRELRIPLLFLLPACTVIGAVVLYPALRVLAMSFTDYNMINPAQSVGVANYLRLWADPLFWSALRNTALYLVVVVPVLVVLPALLAILANKAIAGLAFFRAALYLPVVTSLVNSALVWKWLYAEQGLLNEFLLRTGLTDDQIGRAHV